MPFLCYRTARALPGILTTLLASAALLTATAVAPAWAQQRNLDAASAEASVGGPTRLRQAPQDGLTEPAGALTPRQSRLPLDSQPKEPVRYIPSEFERFVAKQAGVDTGALVERGGENRRRGETGHRDDAGTDIRRLGAELITGSFDGRGAELSPLVPPDYLVSAGDEVLVTLWGSVDADLRLLVDRTGRIAIPRVGAVQVAGLRHADLQEVISGRVAQVFRNFQISVSLGQLRGIRIFVTGQVVQPGAHTVSSLSTVVSSLMQAGGPSAIGSFRNVQLRRGAKLVGSFDLYDLLLKGDRSADQVVQAGDVVHVGPVETQVGVIGSVNRPAVVELKAGETVADALRFVSGFSAVADRSRLAVERLQERNAGRVAQLELPRDATQTLAAGDVLRAFSAVDAVLPTGRQSKRVRVEGEVARPAQYVLPENSSVRDAVRAAGGYATGAYVKATVFTRESVRATQQESYERALRDLETEFARTASSQRIGTAEEATAQQARSSGTDRLLERLRALKPSGRVVLDTASAEGDIPDIALEDGDRIYVPAQPTTVGVFGSVFNAASYLHRPGRTLDEYIRLAGGPTKGADDGSVFVVRANGQVVSSRQTAGGGFFSRGSGIGGLAAEPGDTVFVPEEMDKTTFIQNAKDWTQILYQFGIGLAGIKSAIR